MYMTVEDRESYQQQVWEENLHALIEDDVDFVELEDILNS